MQISAKGKLRPSSNITSPLILEFAPHPPEQRMKEEIRHRFPAWSASPTSCTFVILDVLVS